MEPFKQYYNVDEDTYDIPREVFCKYVEDSSHLKTRLSLGHDLHEKMLNENKELKEEIEKLQEDPRNVFILKWNEAKKENEELKDKNEELEQNNNDLENMLGESYSKHDIADMKQEINELKCPVIPNRDSRCHQFDVRVGYSYAHDMLGAVLTEEQMEYLEDHSDDLDTVIELVAGQIDKAINTFILNPVGEINNHILEYVNNDLEDTISSICNDPEWDKLMG
jgi:hypothetical protein